MRKISFLILAFLFSGVFASADIGRGQEICLSNGGQVSQIRLFVSTGQIIYVCYLGPSIIELNTLDKSVMQFHGGLKANRAYRRTRSFDNNACSMNLGRSIQSEDLETAQNNFICEFDDQSWIGTTTLANGVSGFWNQKLNTALGIF